MEDYRKYFHVDWEDLKVGMTFISSDRGGGSFNEEIIFIKAKREQMIEFDSITIRHGRIFVQYDDWTTKYDWEKEVHLSGRPLKEESKRLFIWQFFHFAAEKENSKVIVRTRAELNKIPMEDAEAREIEREKMTSERNNI